MEKIQIPRFVKLGVVLLASLLFSYLKGIASTVDSLVYPIERYNPYWKDKISFFSNPALFSELGFTEYANTELAGSYLNADYKLRQTPELAKQVKFSTTGIKKIGSFTVAGTFAYNRQWEDSVGYNFRVNANDPAPYFLFAQKNGNMNKGSYYLDANVIKSFLNNRLSVGLTADLSYSSNTRSIDPRPEILTHAFNGGLMLSYKFSGKHLIGASAKIGYGESKTSVAYQNKIYGEGFGSEPHINYINLGYGHYKQSHNVKGARSLNNEDDLTTIGLVYNGIFNSFNITAKANSIRKEQFFNRTHSDGTDWAGIGRFYLDGTEAGVRIEKLLQKGQLIFQTEYSSWSGSDMNTELKGSNYIYENSLFNAMIGYAKTKAGNADKEIYLTMGLESTDRKDGTASVKSSYQIANAGVLLFKRWGLGKVSALNIQLNPSYAKNLSSSLSYNTAQVSNYLKDVIIPDQLFYETDHLNVKADVRYIYRSPQRINWSFGLGIDHTQYMNTPEAMNALGNKQFQIRTSLGFSF